MLSYLMAAWLPHNVTSEVGTLSVTAFLMMTGGLVLIVTVLTAGLVWLLEKKG